MNPEIPLYLANDTLLDGSVVYFRRICPGDKDVLQAQFHKLSPASVRSRFFNAKQELTPRELRFFTEVDFSNHVALVAELGADPQPVPVAVGRFVRSSEHPGHAEIALTVADAHQGKGIGGALLRQLVRYAREVGVSHFDATVLAENRRVSNLMHGLGATTMSGSRDGVCTFSSQLS